MFVQVIEGQVHDAAQLRAQLERWLTEQAGQASGWLGTTCGVTDDGTSVAVVRFDSADSARRNSERPEQGQWWAETEKLFGGPVTFHDCAEVLQMGAGGSDDAGFVQVIQGRTRDEQKVRQMMDEAAPRLREQRPELIGSIIALHGDGGFTQAAYFTSEAEAREGERKPRPPEAEQMFGGDQPLLQDVRFFDLRDPWLFSPR